MQPTEIFARTVKTGIPVSMDTKTVQLNPKSTTQPIHAPRDVVKVEIKLLLHWASKQLDQLSLGKENNN